MIRESISMVIAPSLNTRSCLNGTQTFFKQIIFNIMKYIGIL